MHPSLSSSLILQPVSFSSRLLWHLSQHNSICIMLTSTQTGISEREIGRFSLMPKLDPVSQMGTEFRLSDRLGFNMYNQGLTIGMTHLPFWANAASFYIHWSWTSIFMPCKLRLNICKFSLFYNIIKVTNIFCIVIILKSTECFENHKPVKMFCIVFHKSLPLS